MQLELKKRLLAYLQASGNAADTELENERRELINKMETEMRYIDLNTHSVCVEDLLGADSPKLRSKLGKADGEDYTIEDCEKVSNAIADYICEDFGNDLADAIEYEL